MSPNRRILLNIVATYGRSLFALVIGHFCGSWTLQALGEVDYRPRGRTPWMSVDQLESVDKSSFALFLCESLFKTVAFCHNGSSESIS